MMGQKKVSTSHSGDLRRESSSGVLSVSKHSSKTAVLTVEEERSDSPQPKLLETVSDSTPPSTQAEEENRGKPLPTRPPTLLLRPERVDGEERRDDSLAMSRLSTVKLKARASRGRISMAQSVLTNPWDGDETPGSAAFERVLFKLPAFPPPSALPTGSFKTGLPRNPRETRTFSVLSSEGKAPEDSESSVRESVVEGVPV